MHAVFREATYAADRPLQESTAFREFQATHARQPGYRGTVVADVGSGRYLTVTLWQTDSDMAAAREALGPVVQRLLDPLMTSPSKLLGTGAVVVSDVAWSGRTG
jgi:hypothetical protein